MQIETAISSFILKRRAQQVVLQNILAGTSIRSLGIRQRICPQKTKKEESSGFLLLQLLLTALLMTWKSVWVLLRE